jgi:lipid-binding SYLF domain-containing protein
MKPRPAIHPVLIFSLLIKQVMNMSLKPTRIFTIISLIAVLLSLSFAQTSYGHRTAQTPLQTATRRSQNAAKTIRVVTGMNEDETIPAELFKRAYAIGVFPDVVRTTLLFSQGMKGYGVISSRQPTGWSLPAFYGHGSSKVGLKKPGFKSFDLIILFMKKDVVDWFQGGRLEFEDLKVGVAGPVGKWTKEAEFAMSGIGIIMYALVDGKLKGMDMEEDFMSGAVLNPDNNINKFVYGMKGREVLKGKEPKVRPASPDLTAFQDILNEKFPVSK